MDVQTVPAPGAGIVISGVTPPEITPPGQPPVASSSPAPAKVQDPEHGIAPAIAKLFGPSGLPQPISLNVSYRVLSDHEIVTVFTDPKTGKEVAQFPPEVLIGLAQFFDQEQGATFDRNA